MLRRHTVLALVTGLLLAALAVPASGDDAATDAGSACPDGAPSAGFADVGDDNVHAEAIDCAVELELLLGRTAEAFAPAESLTRGQAAAVLARSLDGVHLPLPTAGPRFDDAGDVHSDAIHRLAAAGIVEGRTEDRYEPDAPVSRAQLASLLVRTLSFVLGDELAPEQPGHHDDTADSVHAEAIDVATEQGLLRGVDDERFVPDADTRRDQAASVLVRLLERIDPELVGEVWSLDQGTDLIHVYGATERDEIATIDVSPKALQDAGFADAPTGDATVPHMIEFDSQERFAFIASTAGGVTIVVDARSKEVVEVLATGAGSHHAAVTPDDANVWVAAIGAEQMVELDLDLDAGEVTIGRQLDVADLLAPIEQEHGWQYPSSSPVCHQFSPDSAEAWVTLGPAWDQGGLFVLDLEDGTASHGYAPDEVKANCGVSVTDETVVVNWSGQVVAGDDTHGEWYVIDRGTRELLDTRDARGTDAHGVRLDPQGESYWMVNRGSDNALVVDADTFEVTREIEDVADSPDILDFSPDGTLLYVSQRGPNPLSGAIHAATGDDPGVAIIDTETGETIDVLRPPTATDGDGDVRNDVHGVAARARGTGEPTEVTATVQPARFDRAAGVAWTCELSGHGGATPRVG